MLSGAKNIMNKVESGDFTKGHVDESRLNNNVDGMLSSIPNGTNQANEYAPRPVANTRPSGQNYQNLHTTKMPANIVKAMMENPIPQQTMGSGGGPTFSLEDVQSMLNNGSTPQPNYQPQDYQPQDYQPKQNNQPQVQQESYNPNKERMITMTETQLDDKINEALMKFMADTFARTLTENTIKKTIGTLIKEGKIKVTEKRKV